MKIKSRLIVSLMVNVVCGAANVADSSDTKWLHVTPNIQLVNNQNRSDSTAVILGLRTVMDF